MDLEFIRMDLEDIIFRVEQIQAENSDNKVIEEALDNLDIAALRLEDVEMELAAKQS